MKAKIFCLSLANPHQALDAYMSFATATARKTSCSEWSHNPCLRRTRSAYYRVCAQAAMTLCACNVTDRLLVNVTPRILIICTRWSSGILSGIENFVFRLWSVKIISWLFVKLSFTLLASAHSLTLCNSAERESTLTAGIERYVSSAYLQSAFPLVTACKSDASTTYDMQHRLLTPEWC